MKSLFGRSYFETELRDAPDRPVMGHMVRVSVRACGVCGTDLHFLRDSADWVALGHEISAEVAEVGSNVTRVKPGDKVIVEDVTMCGACEACKSGRYDLCRNPYRLDGQGGMADQMVVHENMLNRFEGIDWVTASMTEPLAVAISCVEKLDLPPMGSLLIYGMGAIGLFSAAYARLRGAARVDMVARDPSSLRNAQAAEAARMLGADEIFYTRGGVLPDEGAYDAALVAAPPSLASDALARVGYGGRVLAAGVTLSDGAHSNIDINHMVMNKKSLITSLAEPAVNFPLSLQLIERGRIDVAAIITHRLSLDEAGALESLYGRDAAAIKTVMLCG